MGSGEVKNLRRGQPTQTINDHESVRVRKQTRQTPGGCIGAARLDIAPLPSLRRWSISASLTVTSKDVEGILLHIVLVVICVKVE